MLCSMCQCVMFSSFQFNIESIGLIAYTAIVSGCLAVLINLSSSAYNIYRLSSSKEPEDVETVFRDSDWRPIYDCREYLGLILTPVGIDRKLSTSKLTPDNPSRHPYQLWKHTSEGYLINKGYNLTLYLTSLGVYGLANLNDVRKEVS